MEERLKDVEEFGGDLFFGKAGEGAAEIAPAGDAGPGFFAGGGARAVRRSVMAAEFVVAAGHAAAFLAAGQDEGAFGWHDSSP